MLSLYSYSLFEGKENLEKCKFLHMQNPLKGNHNQLKVFSRVWVAYENLEQEYLTKDNILVPEKETPMLLCLNYRLFSS